MSEELLKLAEDWLAPRMVPSTPYLLIRDLAARVRELEAERDALRKDAERLDWLDRYDIDHHPFTDPVSGKPKYALFRRGTLDLISSGDTIRAAIDAALAREEVV